MKKLFLSLALAIGMVVSVSAQKAGDQTINFSLGYETSKSSVVVSAGSESLTESSPSENGFAVGLEYGKFLKDNIRVGLGFTYGSTGQSDSDDKVNTLIVAPSVSYYMPIAKNLYYTPGLTIGYASTSSIEKEISTEYKTELNGYIVGLSLLSFEYRYSEKFAVNLNIGSFQYNSLSYEQDDAKLTVNTKVFDIMSNASVGFSLYF
ncbi:MAG: outer membrane beta-barrel protein [Alistipes sp.]|nr:outer membrane beta-barrel protein [Alistipes sp.]